MDIEGTIEVVSIEKLKDQHKELLSSFSCKNNDENEFLKEDALGHQRFKLSETYLLLKEPEKNKILSYITLTIGSIKLSDEKEFYGIKIKDKPYDLPPSIPCMLVGRIATDKTEAGKGYATFLISFAIKTAMEWSKTVPFPILAVHSYHDKVGFYTKQGFMKAFDPDKPAKSETICMFLHLFKDILG